MQMHDATSLDVASRTVVCLSSVNVNHEEHLRFNTVAVVSVVNDGSDVVGFILKKTLVMRM